jgi:hypothetical protein
MALRLRFGTCSSRDEDRGDGGHAADQFAGPDGIDRPEPLAFGRHDARPARSANWGGPVRQIRR